MYPQRTQDSLSSEDIALIQARESFYIPLTNPDGWPYVQHRGGPVGFLRAHTTSQLVCEDYRENCQFITMGNL